MGMKGMEMKGMIVYSFAWRRNENSPCNVRLALAAKRIMKAQAEPILIFAQRTTASVLKEFGVDCYVVKKQSGYEGSEESTRQAVELFRQKGVTEVIPVAQPVFQLTKCIQLVRKEGFKTLSFWKLARMIGWIGFDRLSVQPATRDPFQLVFYTKQILFGYRPPQEQSEP
jgi:hypothetical protein